jgi:D-serine deaminase-like pyridoxal phosphate-dependent protein
MNAPTEQEDATRSRLQAAVVTDGQISSLALPALCAGQFEVRAARVSDHDVVVSAPAVDKDGACSSAVWSWVRVDVGAGSATSLGSGGGLATLDGGTLIAATRANPDSDTVRVSWQQPTSS